MPETVTLPYAPFMIRYALTTLALTTLALPALLSAQTPSLTGSSRPGFDVLHYDFSVDFIRAGRPDTIEFISEARVHRTGEARTLALDLVLGMNVLEAGVNGTAVRGTRNGAQVELPLPAGRGDTLRVRLRYRGVPIDGLILRSDSSGGWTAFGDNFPDRARHWLATVDHPSDKATVNWNVRAPATHRVIANGTMIEQVAEPAPSGMTVTRYRAVRPLYTAVMVIGLAPFAVHDLGETACGLGELLRCVPQTVWTSPDVRDYMPGPFTMAAGIVSWFSSMVGPFPYEKLAHVQSSTRYGGMENASAIFYADAIYRRRNMSVGLIAHEAAHQWFGDAVTTREWPHVWLSEGFATYFAALWTEHSRGDSAFRAELTQMRGAVLNAALTKTTPVVNTGLSNLGALLNSNVYQKAGFVLHMLRREVGDSAFFRGIRTYYAKYRHGNALTDDFRREVEAAAGTDLAWFFDQWFHRPGFSELGIAWRWEGNRVVLEVSQGTTFPPFRVNLAVDVTDASGQVQRTRVTIPAAATSTVTLPVTLSGPPRAVTFDADVSLLGRVSSR